MQHDDILAQLTTYVADEILDGERRDLTGDTPLLEWGILDSVAMVSLLAFIEEKFNVEIPDEAVRPENFATLGRLAALVCQASAAAA